MGKAVSSVALSSMSAKERRKTKIPEPDQAMYGAMGPAYGTYLAETASNQNPGASAALAAGNAWALRNNYNNDQAAYAGLLKRAQDLQMLAQSGDIQGDLAETALEKMPEYTEKGIGGLLYGQFGDAEGGYGLFKTGQGANVTGNLINRGDRRVANAAESERNESIMRALAAGAPYGIVPKQDVLETLLRNPEADPNEPNPDYDYENISPMQANTIAGTDVGLDFPQQLAIAEAGGRSGDEGLVTVNHGATGEVPTVTYKGTTAQIAAQRAEAIRQGINPNTQAPFTKLEREAMAEEIAAANRTPKAGAESGAAPATPAAVDRRTRHAPQKPARSVTVDLNEGKNDATARFWNQSNITSRSGTRKDPFTGKQKKHEGDDYAGYKRGSPIPAENDGEVVAVENPNQTGGYGNRVKVRYRDGTVKSYSHNDRNLVQVGQQVKRGTPLGTVGSTGRSTGPHVHVRTERQGVNPEAVLANRARKLPNVASVELAGDHSVYHMRDGSTRVYRRGKRVG